jgi:Tol biopolymer transport system component
MGDIWVAKRASTADPWGAPQLVAELASLADDTSPDVSFDGLTMYFSSDRKQAGDRDLYVTTRASRADPWGAPQRIAELASTSEDGSAVETADRLHLVLSSNRSGSSDLYVSTRTAIGQPWTRPVPIPGLSSQAFSENQHHINADATIVYYTSDQGGIEHLWQATCDGPSGPCRDQQQLPVVNSLSADVDPWVSPMVTRSCSRAREALLELYMATR